MANWSLLAGPMPACTAVKAMVMSGAELRKIISRLDKVSTF